MSAERIPNVVFSENPCHDLGCQEPSCCFRNSVIVNRHEIRHFPDAIPLRNIQQFEDLIASNPDDENTYVIEQDSIMDHPSQYLVLFNRNCTNVTEDGNCKAHNKIAACGPNTPIGGQTCNHCRARDGKMIIDVSSL